MARSVSRPGLQPDQGPSQHFPVAGMGCLSLGLLCSSPSKPQSLFSAQGLKGRLTASWSSGAPPPPLSLLGVRVLAQLTDDSLSIHTLSQLIWVGGSCPFISSVTCLYLPHLELSQREKVSGEALRTLRTGAGHLGESC